MKSSQKIESLDSAQPIGSNVVEVFEVSPGKWRWEMISPTASRSLAQGGPFETEEETRAAWFKFAALAASCQCVLEHGTLGTAYPQEAFWLIKREDRTWNWEFVTRELGSIAQGNDYGVCSIAGCRSLIRRIRPRVDKCSIIKVKYNVYRWSE